MTYTTEIIEKNLETLRRYVSDSKERIKRAEHEIECEKKCQAEWEAKIAELSEAHAALSKADMAGTR